MNDPRQLMLFPKPWDIWVEGYLCTGMEGTGTAWVAAWRKDWQQE